MTTGAGPPRPPPPPPRPPPPAPPEFGSRVSQYCALGVGSLLALSRDRKSTRLNSSHSQISYAVFCLTKKKISALSLDQTKTPEHSRPAMRRRARGRFLRAPAAFSFTVGQAADRRQPSHPLAALAQPV